VAVVLVLQWVLAEAMPSQTLPEVAVAVVLQLHRRASVVVAVAAM
jgi:hypothetical protein